MNCKKCGISLEGKDYRMVAQWPFCTQCFQNLMEHTEKKTDSRTENNDALLTQTETKQKCQVCGAEIESGMGHEMLAILFCDKCHENLIKRPAVTPRLKSRESSSVTDSLNKPAVNQVRVNLNELVQCHGCGRKIPALGSKEFNGNFFCPDCFSALSISEEIKYGRESEHICQACGRKVLSKNLKTIKGFEICLACISTDQNAAIEIAREKHKKVLEKIKKEKA